MLVPAQPSPISHADHPRESAADPSATPLWCCPGVHEIFGGIDTQLAGWPMLWADLNSSPGDTSPWWVWIGKGVWPGAHVLRRAGLLERSIWVDAPRAAQVAQAAEMALQCAAVGTVIADGTGMNLRVTRRLQLAIRARESSRRAGESSRRVVLLRPERDQQQLSAAQLRWQIKPVLAAGTIEKSSRSQPPPEASPHLLPRRPRWSVSLLRRKGQLATSPAMPSLDKRQIKASSMRLAGTPAEGHSPQLQNLPDELSAALTQLDLTSLSTAAETFNLDPASPPTWIIEWDPAAATCRIIQHPEPQHEPAAASSDPAQLRPRGQLHPRWPAAGLPVGLPADVAGGSAVATVA